MTIQNKNLYFTIMTLFLVIVIDQIGITFIFPILTPLFMNQVHSIVPFHFSNETRDIFYGICLALYPAFMFFGAPFLGNLSDQIGRKKVLLTCLLGSAASFILSSISIYLNSLYLLLISRAFAGFFSGSQYIAQAAIADISPANKKAVYLSYIIVAISIGMILGPLIGGYFSDPHSGKWFTYSTSFEIAAGFAILNTILLWLLFAETSKPTLKSNSSLLAGFILFKEAFINHKIRLLSLILFLLMFGWTIYFQEISWFLFQRFKFTGNEIGVFIGYQGLGFAFFLVVVLKLLLKYISNQIKIIKICLATNAIALLLALLVPYRLIEWITAPFIIGTMAVAYTLLLTLFSNAVEVDKQGWIMGITGSLVAIAWALAGLITGPLGYITIILPLLVGFLLVSGAFVVTFKLGK